MLAGLQLEKLRNLREIIETECTQKVNFLFFLEKF